MDRAPLPAVALLGAVPLAVACLAAAPRVARAEHPLGRLELGLAAGAYRLQAGQDLGSYERLAELRQGILGTVFGLLELRGSYHLTDWLSVGAVLGFAPGRLAERGALIVAYRAELLLSLPVRWPVIPFAGATGGGLSLLSPAEVLGRDTDPTVGWTAGLRVGLGRRWSVALGVTQLFTDAQTTGAAAQNLAVTAGLGLRLRPPAPPPPPSREPLDSDGDGLVDAVDRCPLVAEDPDGVEDHDGCPEPERAGRGQAPR